MTQRVLKNPDQIEALIRYIRNQFEGRAIIEPRKRGIDYGVSMTTEVKDFVLWVSIHRGETINSFTIPLPFQKGSVTLLEQNDVKRAVCKHFILKRGVELNFIDVMSEIIFGDPEGIIPPNMYKKTTSFIQQLAYSVENDDTSRVMHNLQRALNEVINRMPLHETDMSSWAMNGRVMIIDPDFDALKSPQQRLDYQIEKSRKFFDRGWTQIGLSDGVLSDKNYTLEIDLRKTVPFGPLFHNPARNLFSTLKMRGDEDPLVRSATMQALMEDGVGRKGWNLFTLFANVPETWEDQILVNSRLENLGITYERRLQLFGEVQVEEGQVLKTDQIVSINKDGQPDKLDIVADKVWVHKVSKLVVNVGGLPAECTNVIIKFTRKLKDGVKITNTAANKGVIRLIDNLGVAKDPVTGELRQIDVVVSARAVLKRKNYTQVLEAICNNINGDKPMVFADDVLLNMDMVGDELEARGFRRDGTWECNTAYGELTGVCGKVFWGVTHDVEDMLWDEADTIRKNGRECRVAGLKFSHVEMRALTTRFGSGNAISDEVMSYVQGSEDLNEQIMMMESKTGKLPENTPVIDVLQLAPVDQSSGTITSLANMVGTIADEEKLVSGFIMKLPVTYQAIFSEVEGKVVWEGFPRMGTITQEEIDTLAAQGMKSYVFNKIYIPSINLRRPWRHPSGKYGLSDVAAWLNNIVVRSHAFANAKEDPAQISLLYKVIFNYFKSLATKMGSKRGEIATYGMSVRYPFSAKAVATLSCSLPKNVVQIHRNMAEKLSVKEGDVVLVERFPCLGFMSVRPQKITITDDPRCKFTIRVSGNSLGSMGLDFDGDVIYLASFHTPQAKETLLREWTNPNASCYKCIKELNSKMGKPDTSCLNLQDYKIEAFAPLTAASQSEIVGRLTGVKSHTGPVIALAYNLMRIVENSDIKGDKKTQVAVEMFLDKVGNSVFKQKHGFKSLHEIVTEAICMADVNALVAEGFKHSTSQAICDTIRAKAAARGVTDLVRYHQRAKERGGSTIINRIVREDHRIYFASRSILEGCEMLKALESPGVDIPSKLFHWVRAGKAASIVTPLENFMVERGLSKIKRTTIKNAGRDLCDLLDCIMSEKPKTEAEVKVPNIRYAGFNRLHEKAAPRVGYVGFNRGR